MSIILTPGSPLISIDLYYVEEKKPTGNVVFHFINDETQMEKWRNKGYKTEQELQELQKKHQTQGQKQPNAPGAPIEQNTVSSKLPEIDFNKAIKIIHTEWKKLSWKDQNFIFSRALKTSTDNAGKTHTELDSILYRDLKLKSCLKKWNVRNENDEPITVSTETIDMLVPEVAQEMLNAFEKFTEPTGDELKN